MMLPTTGRTLTKARCRINLVIKSFRVLKSLLLMCNRKVIVVHSIWRDSQSLSPSSPTIHSGCLALGTSLRIMNIKLFALLLPALLGLFPAPEDSPHLFLVAALLISRMDSRSWRQLEIGTRWTETICIKRLLHPGGLQWTLRKNIQKVHLMGKALTEVHLGPPTWQYLAV